MFGTLFSISNHSNICTFCWTHTWAVGQRLLLAYLPHPHSPPFSSLLISPSPLQPCYSPKTQTWTQLLSQNTNLNPAKIEEAWTPISIVTDDLSPPTCSGGAISSIVTQWCRRSVKTCDPFPQFVTDDPSNPRRCYFPIVFGIWVLIKRCYLPIFSFSLLLCLPIVFHFSLFLWDKPLMVLTVDSGRMENKNTRCLTHPSKHEALENFSKPPTWRNENPNINKRKKIKQRSKHPTINHPLWVEIDLNHAKYHPITNKSDV